MIPRTFLEGACSHLLRWLLLRRQEYLAISKTFEHKVGLTLRPRNPEGHDGSTLDWKRGGQVMNGVLAHFNVGSIGSAGIPGHHIPIPQRYNWVWLVHIITPTLGLDVWDKNQQGGSKGSSETGFHLSHSCLENKITNSITVLRQRGN